MIKYLVPAASLNIAAISLVWCLNLRDPHLLPVRNYEAWILVGLLLVLFALAWKIKSVYVKRIQIAFCAGLLLFVARSEYVFHTAKHRLLHNPTKVEKEINRRLIVGFNDYEEAEQLARNGVGGIFLSRRNIQGLSYEELKKRIHRLQAARGEGNLPPLFIATDQEGGPVSRLSPLVERQPPLSKLVAEKDAQSLAFEYGKQQGSQLRALGVNVNFSPVVDLRPPRASGALDFHTRIRSRAISDKPEEVVAISGAYIKGLNTAGITATLKHFPGLMRVEEDTHHFSASLDTNITVLHEADWLPFSRLPKMGDTWIMLSHVILKGVDPVNPVSASHIVVDRILRKELGFTGVLITDDLTMGATYNRGFCKSVRDAYDADIDYLLIAYDYEKYYKTIGCITDRSAGHVK